MTEKFGPDLMTIISVLQTALTPAFLLVAISGILNILTVRLSRIVDRSRELQDRHSEVSGADLVRLVQELRITERRMKVVELSILFSVLSAITVAIMIGMLFLMGLTDLSMTWGTVGVFIIALTLLASALVLFVREIQLATRAIHVPEEFLEYPDDLGV